MKTTFIYALCEPGTGKIRYVGKSNNPKRRLGDHLCTSVKMKTHLGNWLRLLKFRSERPALEILDEIADNQWELWEREYLRVFRALGMDLVNTTEGGDGGPVMCGKNNPGFGKHRTDEVKAKIGRGNSNKTPTAETRKKMSEAGHNRPPISEETRAKLAATSTGRIKSLETRNKLCAAWTPERHANMSERTSGKNHWQFGKSPSPETRAKISATLKARAFQKENS